MVFEMKPSTTLISMAIGCSEKFSYTIGGSNYSMEGEIIVESGACMVVDYYVALNLESDGASTATIDLKRRGFE